MIAGDKIFLSGFAEGQLSLTCFHPNGGSVNWNRQFQPGFIEKGSHLSHPATATPATDGKVIVTYFASYGVLCHDLEGNLLWEKQLPVPILQHGAGTSPVIAGDKVLLACDNDLDSYLLCADLATGQTAWKIPRPGFKRGFSTPLVFPADAPEQVILPGSLCIVSYNLSNGTERWRVSGLPNEMVSSATASGSHIFVAGWTHGSGVKAMPSFETLLAQDANGNGTISRSEAPAGPAKQHFVYLDADKNGELTRAEYEAAARLFDRSENVAMSIDPSGSGDVTETKVLWRHRKGLPYCPTPLVYGDQLYLVKNGGLLTSVQLQTGKPLFEEERLGALGDYYASPVAADGKICVVSQPGTAVVLRHGESLEILARNSIGEAVIATPALAGGYIYIRTSGSLFAFADKETLRLSAR